MSRQISNKLNKTSIKSIDSLFKKIHVDEDVKSKFTEIVSKDCKLLRDCSERSIVDFYIDTFKKMINENLTIDEEFYSKLKARTRTQLARKYTSSKTFDNNIDIYFNEVKREYILHPQGESDDLEFCEENRDIFIKNNLKLVVEAARRYQNLGLPLEDLIQFGNIGLLTAFDKFDTERANLRFSIVKDIKSCHNNTFTFEEATDLIKRNFTYTKSLESTSNKLPKEGFSSKEDFINWTNENVKKASFASISFIWIRASIINELNKLSKIIRVPKSAQQEGDNQVSIIRLDSLNPHTDDNYSDNIISDTAMDEFIIEDESMEQMERQNVFKALVSKALDKLSVTDRRIVKKRYGIDMPYQLSINDIAENENLTPNKVKYILSNALKVITNSITAEDKKTLLELLK